MTTAAKEIPLGTHENPDTRPTTGKCPAGHGFINRGQAECPTCGVSLVEETAGIEDAETETE